MSTAGIEFIRNEMDWDTYDAWASVRSAQFDLAEAWYGCTGKKLSGYEPSPLFQDTEWETERAERLYQAMCVDIITRDDIEYWWSILDRMEALVILAGRDY